MFYTPSKLWCRRLAIPPGSVVRCDVVNTVRGKRNRLQAVNIVLVSDGLPVGYGTGIDGWKLAKHP